jgi:hypothetical protein
MTEHFRQSAKGQINRLLPQATMRLSVALGSGGYLLRVALIRTVSQRPDCRHAPHVDFQWRSRNNVTLNIRARKAASLIIKHIGAALFAYLIISTLAFGDFFQPIALVTVWSNRLGAPRWEWLVIGSMSLGALFLFLPMRHPLFRLPLFITVAGLGSLVSVGIYAEHLRSQVFDSFRADREIRRSFFQSVRHAPRDVQFFLHATALKNCVPYAWSYRKMSLYELHPDVAVNVLPRDWLVACAIHSDNAVGDRY